MNIFLTYIYSSKFDAGIWKGFKLCDADIDECASNATFCCNADNKCTGPDCVKVGLGLRINL